MSSMGGSTCEWSYESICENENFWKKTHLHK